MEIHLAVRGSQTAVSELFLDGKALLAEAKTAKPDDKPLLVTGDRLEVIRADLPDTKIVVFGKPGHVEARAACRWPAPKSNCNATPIYCGSTARAG